MFNGKIKFVVDKNNQKVYIGRNPKKLLYTFGDIKVYRDETLYLYDEDLAYLRKNIHKILA